LSTTCVLLRIYLLQVIHTANHVIIRVLFAVLTVLGLLCCCGCIAGAAFAFRRRRIATE
uniref:Uncharacterized protein n=1 Tax=Parascaris univalens TaxID=6257 RepID=A0A915BYS1_PARUN